MVGQQRIKMQDENAFLQNDNMNLAIDQQIDSANVFTFLVETFSRFHNPNGKQETIPLVEKTTEIQLEDSSQLDLNQTTANLTTKINNLTKKKQSLIQRPPSQEQLISEEGELSLDFKNEYKLKVPLESRGDALYLGQLHLGTPFSQPVKVVFDTGSEFLAVTSVLCKDSTTPELFRFKRYDPIKRQFV